MKKIVASMLLIVMLLSAVTIGTASMLNPAERYEMGLSMLRAYLSQQNTNEEGQAVLAQTIDMFMSASGHEAANGFLLYARTLDEIEKGGFDVAEVYLRLLKRNDALNQLLADKDFAKEYGSIHSVETLEQYVTARKAEAAEDYASAIAAYEECQNFFDSASRVIDLLMTGAPLKASTPVPMVTPIAYLPEETPAVGVNLLQGGEGERRSSNGYVGIPCAEALEQYVGRTITVSFEVLSWQDCTLWLYAYQNSGISISIPDSQPSLLPVKAGSYQRFAITTSVKDFGRFVSATGNISNAGAIGIYDPSSGEKADFTVRRIKIELGNRATEWSESPQATATPAPATETPKATEEATQPPTQPPTPAPTAAPTITLSGRSQSEVNTLSWNAVPGAEGYTLRRRLGSQNASQVYSGTATTYADSSVMGNYTYTYVVTARLAGGVTIESNEVAVLTSQNTWVAPTPAPTPAPTKAPTPAPTKAPTPAPTKAPTAAPTKAPTAVPTTPPPTATPAPQWGAWSAWSTTAVTASSTRQVETEVRSETVYKTQYNYNRYMYYNTTYNAWYFSYAQYSGVSYKAGSGTWQYKTVDSPLAQIGTSDGHPKYDGTWYNQSTSQVANGTKNVTYYRYRDRVN